MKASNIIKSSFLNIVLGITVLSASSCGGEVKISLNPHDAIDGYALYVSEEVPYILLDTEGNPVFAGKTVVLDDGSEEKGEDLSLYGWGAGCSVNGLFKLKRFEDGKYYFLSHELDQNNKLVWMGPYDEAGNFYDELAPAIRPGDKGIAYINREGEVKLWADKVMGTKVSYAWNFLGGLSVVGMKMSNNLICYGAIDTKGNIVFQPKYRDLYYVGGGIWLAEELDKNKNMQYNDCTIDLINRKGEVIFSFPRHEFNIKDLDRYKRYFGKSLIFNGKYGILSTEERNHWKVIDNKGKVMYENLEGYSPMSGFTGKLAIFRKDSDPHCDIIMNEKGKIVANLQKNQYAEIAESYYMINTNERKENTHSYDIYNVYNIYNTHGDSIGFIGNNMGNSIPLNNSMIVQYRQEDYRDKRGYFIQHSIGFYANNGWPMGSSYPTGKNGRLIYEDNKMLVPISIIGIPNHEEMWMPEIADEKAIRPTKLTHGTAADIKTYDLKGRVRRCSVYEYGSKMNDISFDRQGKLEGLFSNILKDNAITRDSIGRIVEIREKSMDEFEEESIMYTLFTYDESGRVIKKEVSSDYGSWTDLYEYNEAGRMIKRKCSGGGAGDFEEIYDYETSDLNGNWIKRTKSVKEWNSTVTEERVISYY